MSSAYKKAKELDKLSKSKFEDELENESDSDQS